MDEKSRRWLMSADKFGALDKAEAHRAGVAIGLLLDQGYVKNLGPDNPSQWDLYITDKTRAELKRD